MAAVLGAIPSRDIAGPTIAEVVGFRQENVEDVLILLLAALAGSYLVLALLRGRQRWKAHRSAWRTFHDTATLLGLTAREIDTVAGLVRRAKLPQPCQVFWSVRRFDEYGARARGHLTGPEQVLLAAAREKVIRSFSVPAFGPVCPSLSSRVRRLRASIKAVGGRVEGSEDRRR